MPKLKSPQTYEKIFSRVAKKVSPTAEEAEEEKAFAGKVLRRLQAAFGRKAQLFFVGSTARDTGIRGDRDIDLFVAFPKERSKEHIVRQTISTVKKIIPAKWEMHYAEHPYLQASVQGYKLEVVPCFKIEVNGGVISAVDRTPLHALYLQKNLTERQKGDVRVLKALLKAHSLYGAELEVQGFSGLACEYLILNYRSLLSLLAAAADWKPPVILDIEDYYGQEFGQLKKRFGTPLIIVDFIDKNRNAAAATSPRNFSRFVLLARALLKNPSEKFFAEQKAEPPAKKALSEMARRNLMLLQLPTPGNLVEDILVPQLRRTASSIAKQLSLEDFRVFNQHAFRNPRRSYVLLELEALQLYSLKKIRGPPPHFRKDSEGFLKAHPDAARGAYVDVEGKLVIEESRKENSALALINKMKGSPQRYGIASHFLKPFKHAVVLQGERLAQATKKDPFLRAELGKFLFSREAY